MTKSAFQLAAERLRTQATSDWYDDPVGWAENCIEWPTGESLTAYQKECLTKLIEKKRIAVRGPHGLGKTTSEAIAILWFACTRERKKRDWKIATTAGAWRQLERYLWPEVHKWSKLLKFDVIGLPKFTRNQLLALNLKLTYGQAFAVASDDPQLIEGVHADEVLYIFDESKSIIAGTFDAAEGAFSGSGNPDSKLAAYAMAMSTPGEPNGRFYDIHTRKPGFEDWWARHVTVRETIEAGRVSQNWVDQRARQWGADSGIFANRVLGEFHSSDEDSTIPLSWVEAANLRWREWTDAGRPTPDTSTRRIGVDVARSGNDKSMLATYYAPIVMDLREMPGKSDTMATTGVVVGMLEADPGRTAVVDVIGVGGGVVDRLRKLGLSVIAFNASEASTAKDRSGELGFTNKRSEAWWHLRELLDPAYGATLALPDDDKLTGDLTAPRWKVLSGGKIQIESKDEVRKRIGRSTDSGDAVVQAVFEEGHNGAAEWLAFLARQAQKQKKPSAEVLNLGLTTRDAARQVGFQGGVFR